MKIAILDDDPVQLDFAEEQLRGAGYQCRSFVSGRDLIRGLREEHFDLFLLDWNAPDLPGLSVLEWIRNQIGSVPPVLLLTRQPADDDMVLALNAGADDFLSKPVKPEVLLARVRALGRRTQLSGDRSVESYGPFEFDMASRRVRRDGLAIEITPKEFQLAILLFRNANMAVSRAYLLETIWGISPTAETRTLDIHMSKIRRKMNLAPENGYILSPVYGYGYRLEELSPM